MLATIVDTEALLETVVAAVVSGLGVTLVFSLAIFGFARSADATRTGRTGEAAIFGAIAIAGLAATAAAVVFGVIVMTTK